MRLLVHVNVHVVHEYSSSIHAKQWLERRKLNLDIINLGGCLVTMDVVLLYLPFPMDFSSLMPSLVWLSVGVRFHEGITCTETVARFLYDASRPSFRNGWYQLELLIGVKGHSEECGAFVENATQLLIYIGTDK